MFNRSNLTDAPLIEKQKTALLIGRKKVHEGHCGEWIKWVDGKLIEWTKTVAAYGRIAGQICAADVAFVHWP